MLTIKIIKIKENDIMNSELKFYKLMKYGKEVEIGYVAYNDGIWVKYKDIGNYFGYRMHTYSIIWNDIKDEYKDTITVSFTDQYGDVYPDEQDFIHISVILDLARRNDELSNNARTMVYDLEKNTPLEGEVSEAEAVNEFLEIWRDPNTTNVKITYTVVDEETKKREELWKAWRRSGAKTTCPSWIKDVLK
jgi:hypothetical protein